jgi:hypothetical protein
LASAASTAKISTAFHEADIFSSTHKRNRIALGVTAHSNNSLRAGRLRKTGGFSSMNGHGLKDVPCLFHHFALILAMGPLRPTRLSNGQPRNRQETLRTDMQSILK